jgi:hypothetical protein
MDTHFCLENRDNNDFQNTVKYSLVLDAAHTQNNIHNSKVILSMTDSISIFPQDQVII